ncbi:MAG: bacillithiol transferase BstA [Thermaerobacter sp.]|nr:metal-dependent hydrolase [Bacillota bacterium]
MADPRYPIGRFQFDADRAPELRAQWIEDLAQAPALLRQAVAGLNDRQLDTPYREGGWTVRQVVHHVADSHLNAYVRLRLALTEERPVIKPYSEKAWAELSDARTAPVDSSLALVEGLHQRWVALLRSLRPDDFARTFQHPETGEQSLDRLVAFYAWHGKHHAAHIRSLRERMGW